MPSTTMLIVGCGLEPTAMDCPPHVVGSVIVAVVASVEDSGPSMLQPIVSSAEVTKLYIYAFNREGHRQIPTKRER